MSVKARFYVSQVTRFANAQNINVVLHPVTRKTEDNVDWSKFTPSGKIELSVTNESTAEWFEKHLGKDVAISFEAVEPLN